MIFFRIDLGLKYGLGHYNRIKSLINYLKIKNYKIIIDKLPNSTFLNKEKKNIYYHRYSGLINGIMGKSSWFRPKVQ